MKGSIQDDKDELEANKKALFTEIEREMRGLTGSLARVTAEMPKAAGKLARKAQGAETRALDVQASLDKILATSTSQAADGLERVVTEARQLESDSSEIRQWWHGFKRHNLAFKHLVAEKLQGLGVEIDMSAHQAAEDKVPGVDQSAMDKEVDGLLRDQEGRMTKRLSQIYADADA